jgi:hypothetical protein
MTIAMMCRPPGMSAYEAVWSDAFWATNSQAVSKTAVRAMIRAAMTGWVAVESEFGSQSTIGAQRWHHALEWYLDRSQAGLAPRVLAGTLGQECRARLPMGQTLWIMANRNAVVSPNRSIPFNASNAPIICHWLSRYRPTCP